MSPRFESWGRLGGPAQTGIALAGWRTAAGSVLPYGNGRSYGDSCFNSAGALVDMRGRNRILGLDPETGVIRCEPGVMLWQIAEAAAPYGLFLPVTPGTRFVTIAGAVANDVHGKNHHRRGTLGRHVASLRLERSDRATTDCSPTDNAALFSATIGGMGLTGIITEVALTLMRVPSLAIRQVSHRFERLDDYFELSDAHDDDHEYSVAWIDQLARGDRFGRGVLMLGDHASEGGLDATPARPLGTVPFTPPLSALNRLTLTAFNALYYGRAPMGRSEATVRWDSYFYPLDRVIGWNRLYGPRGLMQHQSVVPERGGREAVRELLSCAARHGQGSFLTVLKRFGDVPSPGLLSFPRAGYTLTLDFPHAGPRTLALMAELDAITVAAGGAVNPYKDARMSPATFAASFPNWRTLEAQRDPKILSDFWRRTALQLGAERPLAEAAE
ncbi:FAD-binding oxidoreductase [Methylobrevis albus]|uniref:FAD-binding oxidoreductase n=1 Tax=Methylobrevis albus TaxID=2793297 RepID=A0A931I0N2_9HYPH|nr:FAD-binding oxidoreductase [Methylobrevis albus]MBH0237123.1 FAD-binding oxidoreductase [Methylobrevis albus]